MAVFLVDYENVCATGLKGVQFLTEKDSIIIFYSKGCKTIRRDEMDAIFRSKCGFKIYKLVQAYKNGLDFYIAAETGALAEKGETQIAIISNDNGFRAVLDFLRMKYDGTDFQVVKSPAIEQAITSLNAPEDGERRVQLQKNMNKLDLGQEYAKYQERNAFKERIHKALTGTDYAEKASEIIQYASEHSSVPKKSFYTGTLHNFGRADGMAIYRILKEVI
jgi:hypothetical protein